MTRRSIPERSTQGFNLIPVSGVGEAVGGVSEAVGGVSEAVGVSKIGGNGVEGTFSNDMTCGEMTCGHTQTNRQALEPNVQSHLACAGVSVQNVGATAKVLVNVRKTRLAIHLAQCMCLLSSAWTLVLEELLSGPRNSMQRPWQPRFEDSPRYDRAGEDRQVPRYTHRTTSSPRNSS